MSYSKANILTLAGKLCHDLDNSTTISTFFDDVINEFAFLPKPIFIGQDFVSITSGTGVYSFPSDALRILHSFYGDEMLIESSEEEFDAYAKAYRTTQGEPKAITYDLLSNQFRLVPVPDTTSTVGGDALNSSFTSDWAWLLYANSETTYFWETFALPLTFAVLAKEFSYESKHQDIAFAENCSSIAKLIFNMLGYDYD